MFKNPMDKDIDVTPALPEFDPIYPSRVLGLISVLKNMNSWSDKTAINYFTNTLRKCPSAVDILIQVLATNEKAKWIDVKNVFERRFYVDSSQYQYEYETLTKKDDQSVTDFTNQIYCLTCRMTKSPTTSQIAARISRDLDLTSSESAQIVAAKTEKELYKAAVGIDMFRRTIESSLKKSSFNGKNFVGSTSSLGPVDIPAGKLVKPLLLCHICKRTSHSSKDCWYNNNKVNKRH